MEGPMVSSRMQSLRKRKLEPRSPFWPPSSYCPCPQSSFIDNKPKTPHGHSHFLAKSAAAIIRWLHQQKKLIWLTQTEKRALNSSGYLGKLENWVQKMGRNKGKAGEVQPESQHRARPRWARSTHLRSSEYRPLRQPVLLTCYNRLAVQPWASCLTSLCFNSSSVKSTFKNAIFQNKSKILSIARCTDILWATRKEKNNNCHLKYDTVLSHHFNFLYFIKNPYYTYLNTGFSMSLLYIKIN